MEDKNMYCKLAYKCAICGKEHSEISERIKCETACLKKQEAEAKKAAEEKKNAEQNARKKEVDIALNNLIKLHDAYVKDYGYYEFESDAETNDYHIWPSKFFHYFFM